MNQHQGRDKFDRRPGVMKGFYEAASLVTITNLHRGSRGQRNKVFAVYDNYSGSPGGFVEWCLNPGDNGIANYDENANLTRFPTDVVGGFLEQTLAKPDTAAIIAMDTKSNIALKRRADLNPRYLRYGVGILLVNTGRVDEVKKA